ncbi:MAG: cupin domain-containing protein [Dysgonamonadaceae bacterium]|jgi:quercetin dioxygenase-like cupin family protein|nr:cupin domain-containing protein [Dysgonamonadaceae bacterium]
MKYQTRQDFNKANIFGTGIPNFMLAKNMTGKSYLKLLKMVGREMVLANVTFVPGGRCFWHIHRGTRGGGQILICTAGEGWYQEEGKDPESLVPGTVKSIPTDLLHWHGAKKDSWFSHIAVEIGGDNVKNEFVRPVTEKEYDALAEPQMVKIPVGTSAFDKENVFGKGKPNDIYAQYFTGSSYLNPLTKPEKGKPFVANVTFEPGCRNHWHIHKASSRGGQVLICTAGEGWYQKEGKRAQSLKPGDTVYIPAGVKHWHGAKKDCWFSHLSIDVPGENCSNEWLDAVTDSHYNKLPKG